MYHIVLGRFVQNLLQYHKFFIKYININLFVPYVIIQRLSRILDLVFPITVKLSF